MRATRYRRHRITSPDLLVYTRLMAEDNGAELLRLRHALGHALREEVTRQAAAGPLSLLQRKLHHGGDRRPAGVDRTTVSRTLKRGEQRLLRCLRYGGAALLRESFGEDGAENLRPPIDKRRSGVR